MQSVAIYANEFSPANLRGALNLMFQLSTCVGLLVAQIINYFVVRLLLPHSMARAAAAGPPCSTA